MINTESIRKFIVESKPFLGRSEQFDFEFLGELLANAREVVLKIPYRDCTYTITIKGIPEAFEILLDERPDRAFVCEVIYGKVYQRITNHCNLLNTILKNLD